MRGAVTSIQKVLLIDDAREVQELVRHHLVGERVELISCGDSSAGLEIAINVQPDLILLDVDMPEIDGYEICRRLKSDPATAVIPLIFLSGSATSEQKSRGLDLGAVDYIGKPFDPAELRARVRASLRTKMLMDLLSTQAMLDGLTGVWNRTYLEERLNVEFARCRRTGEALSVILVDVDRFKSINDRFGHPFGDHVLQRVATLLTEHSREEDSTCRYGGEEFAIVCVGSAEDSAAAMAERLRRTIEATPFDFNGESVTVTCSLGVAGACENRVSTIDRADRALYRAKQSGRNRVVACEDQPLSKTG